ncbi:class I SAM-dependent methyltransferase [Flaviaesturariibacter flavus]|uniref:Class I SAM-dependent methyltransferase n=1 Tax=Flaviaesturariibacter flavus TaxID=2502780 RepID=A0A4R1BQ46_9BACT|nr:class I SAM-dependent methyltransferase [Flaviaesturariibacter flavus]TCJ19648.1 class I SAM-dependent methyltransferase [Flaviaesturariibacter flavus]
MSATVHYTHCPVCNSSNIHPLLTATDHTVSRNQFVIWQCDDCSLRFTQDVPDAAHIGPYYKSEDYISHTDTKEGLVNRIYQQVRRHTLQQKVKLAMRVSGKQRGRALDVGCGTGAFLAALKEAGWVVTGLEPDPDARKIAAARAGLEVLPAEALYELPHASFDVITLWHVLEHVHELQRYMQQLRALLAPGGKLIIAVPNYTSGDAQTYGAFWAAYDVPRHLYHFSPRSMKTLAERNGLRLVDQKPMWFDSVYISLLSSRYRHGQTNWIGAPMAGLRSNFKAFFNPERCSSLTYVLEAVK